MWYIFRHGETFDNLRKDRVMGHTKHIYLTYNGILQTYLNGLKLLKTKEDLTKYKFVCSPLERADHTCQLLLDTVGLRFDRKEQEYLLIERTQGEFDGLTHKYIYELYPKELELMKNNNWSCVVCKNYNTHKNVFLQVIDFIKKYENEKNLVAVAHEGICQKLMYLLQKKLSVKELRGFVNNLSDKEGHKLVCNLNKTVAFNQNYFYSWDGNDLVRI